MTRDRLARVLGFVVGVASTVLVAFHRVIRSRIGGYSLGPALVEFSPLLAWSVLILATVAYAYVMAKTASELLWRSWLVVFAATYSTALILRTIFVLTR